MNQLKQREKRRIYGLDSLRFAAFLMVFLFHSSEAFFFGFLGVDFFFVLSSFLLTYLAFTEIEKTGEFSRKNFFLRRVLRIFPLYYLVVFFSFVLLPFLAEKAGVAITLPEKEFYFWTFLSNYDNSQYLLPLKFLWSIAVEEQFYLLFLLLSLSFRKHFWYIISFLLLVYVVFMISEDYFGWERYKSVLLHLVNFAFGMAAGYLFYLGRINIKKRILLPGLLLSFILLFPTVRIPILFNLLLSLFFVLLIFSITYFGKKLARTHIFRLSEYLGKYTYGLYVYSGFVIVFFNKFLSLHSRALSMLLEFIFLLIVAFLSYHLYEKHFLKLKKYFRKV
ncbi:acyltransferase [Zunongwangia sp. F363]|uniref:Acyltransferase n=1 Tax=Autumnicola tepida TaxID=3075595 RepID=A0ABU3CAD6_9FLAO|nr:acyltransferase [Zunongwangia sp. F363]MDT0643307.1 acyltransferase [Zunongwangia sp. F363]